MRLMMIAAGLALLGATQAVADPAGDTRCLAIGQVLTSVNSSMPQEIDDYRQDVANDPSDADSKDQLDSAIALHSELDALLPPLLDRYRDAEPPTPDVIAPLNQIVIRDLIDQAHACLQ